MAEDRTQTGSGRAASRFTARWLFSPLQGVRLGDWLRVLRDNRVAVEPRFWPRAALTTLGSVANSVIARREAARVAGQMPSTVERPPVFVIGHHRSGTTHLWNLLATNPRFAYPTVLQAIFPLTFLTVEGAMAGLMRTLGFSNRPQDNVALTPRSPASEERALCALTFVSIQMVRHFPHHRERFERFLTMRNATAEERESWKQAFDWFARKLLLHYGAERTLLFKSPDHTAKIALIREVFPDARFVHVHRHPCKVYQSTRWMEQKTQPLFAYQRQASAELDAFIVWRYRRMYEAYFEDVQALEPGVLAEVRFEDLVDNPRGEVERIHKELDLPDFEHCRPRLEEYLRRQSGYRRNEYVELEPEIRQRLASEWQFAFERFGYADSVNTHS